MPSIKLYVALLALVLVTAARHPYHVNVIEIRESAGSNTWQMTVRVFTHEWEETLRKTDSTKIDLKNEVDSVKNNQLLKKYLESHLHVYGDSITINWNWVGFESRNDETWCYFESSVQKATQLKLECDILYEHGHEQQTIVHWYTNGKRISNRVLAPEKTIVLKRN